MPGVLTATKGCFSIVAVWLELTPNRVWKGAVLVIAPANLGKKYKSFSKVTNTDKYKILRAYDR